MLALAGCGGPQDTLDPHSHQAADIANLFWVMMAVSFGGLALITGLLVFAWLRRGRRGFGADPDDPHPGERPSWFVVVGMGVVFPLMIVAALFIVGNWAIMNVTQAPAASSTDMTVEAVGHQWYWEFRYPGTKAVNADELHIPVGTRVNLVATTADVIHSFWVPELNRKIDAIPGRTNHVVFDARSAGVFRGQCAEFCGLQHAHMALYVVAEPRADFERWLARTAAPAPQPANAELERGQQVLLGSACEYCHRIAGTNASGTIGPDLTHVATRLSLGAGTIPNGRGYLAGWVLDPQHVKPGNRMPATALTGPALQSLLDYLESLR